MNLLLNLRKKRHLITTSVLFYLLSFSLLPTVFAQVPEGDTTSSSALIAKGTQMTDEGKFEEALAIYQQVPECDPNYRVAFLIIN